MCISSFMLQQRNVQTKTTTTTTCKWKQHIQSYVRIIRWNEVYAEYVK